MDYSFSFVINKNVYPLQDTSYKKQPFPIDVHSGSGKM